MRPADGSLHIALLAVLLLTLLPATSQLVRDLLCFSLSLAACAQHDAALGSFLLGHKVYALAGSPDGPASAGVATQAAFGFGIIAVGDAVTGRRLLLGISNSADRMRSPLFAGIVESELVGLQAAAGDLTSASHWLERTQRFAERYDCRLLTRRALEAREHTAIPRSDV